MRRRIPHLRWYMVAFFMFVMMFNFIDRSSLSIGLSLISHELHIREGLAGILSSAFFWSYTIVQIPGGWLIHKAKPRATISGALLGWGIVQALTAVASSFNVFLWFRIILGVFEGPVENAMNVSMVNWLAPHERGRGSTTMDSGGQFGSALGSIAVTGLIVWLGTWRAAFIFIGAITILIAVLAFAFVRNSPEEHPLATEQEVRYLHDETAREDQLDAQEHHSATGASDLKRQLSAVKSPSAWLLILGWAAFDALFYGFLTWAPYYLSNSRGVSFAGAGIASMIIYLGGGAGELSSGQLADRWRRRATSPNVVMKTILGGAGVATAVCVLLINAVTGATAAIVLLTASLFFLRFGGLYWSIPQMLVPHDQVAMLSGAMNFGGNIGGIVAPIAVGFIAQATGSFAGVFLMFGCCGAILAICGVFMNYDRQSLRHPHAPGGRDPQPAI